MNLGKLLGLACLVALGSGCGGDGNPSFDTASHQFYTVYCTRLHECMKEIQGADQGEKSFKTAYPGGETDCVDQNFKEFSSLSTLESTCSQERWDACTEDLKNPAKSTCIQSPTTPAIGLKIPESCKGC